FSNSEVKTLCADASVDFVDVKVGHCQALNLMKMKPSPTQVGEGFFVLAREISAERSRPVSTQCAAAWPRVAKYLLKIVETRLGRSS
ncbi:MAG TPA: hypothetical protein VK652_07525, partial [Steroidobacteraceae bacterium]|nr:hypothetical protein [Steroidobacteraceae bacterium]